LVGDYATTETVIEETAVPIPYDTGNGDEGPGNVPNHATGWGEIDALAAVQAAVAMCGDSAIVGQVTDADTSDPIAGADILASSATEERQTTSDADGFYALNVFSGTYDLAATAFGYAPALITDVVATAGMTTTQDIQMQSTDWHTVSGAVTDAATGWPLYANLDFPGYPVDQVWTNPVDGSYSVQAPEGITFTFEVNAWTPGYQTASRVVGPLTADATEDFALEADLGTCIAPGYVISGTCEAPTDGGLVVGNVYDANYPLVALNGAEIVNEAGYAAETAPTPDDGAVDDGFYTLFSPSGTQVFTATAMGYGAGVVDVTVVDGDTVAQDFLLPAGLLSAAPDGLDVTVELGYADTRTLELVNTGNVAAEFALVERAGQVYPVHIPSWERQEGRYVPEPLERVREYDPLATTAEGLFASQIRYASSSILAAGDVLAFWPSGDTLPRGTGFDLDGGMVWVNDNAAGGGSGLNEEFDVSGARTGANFTPAFGGSWPGDMAYNTSTGMFWQVNVGGDNCIYEWDPSIPAATGHKICGAGWTATAQRGLAYNAADDTYLIGGWNDAQVYEIDNTGATIKSCTLNLSISGLAHNWEAGLLFAMLNDAPNTVEVIDWASCSVIDSIVVAGGAFGDYSGAGLGVDCNGNLWAANQSNKNVYLIDSGVPANLCTGVPWLDETPTAGTVSAAGDTSITVDFDAAYVDQPGEYHAELIVKNDTPYSSFSVPVTMTVLAPGSWAKLMGTVTGLGICDADPAPLEGAEVWAESATTGQTWMATTDISGTYHLWMDQAHSPLTVTVSAPDYYGQEGGVEVKQGETTVLDFDLRLLQPCLSYEPADFDVTLPMGDNLIETLILSNTGAADAAFELLEIPGGDIPWVSADPITGTIATDDAFVVNLTFDAGVPQTMQPGTYYGQLMVSNNAANAVPNVPLTLTVTPPDTWGKLMGEVTGLGYCDTVTPTLLADADITVASGAGAIVWDLTTDVSGTYQLWLDAAHSPLTVTVEYPEH
ncbi:MAG TPA: carboxypeptidase regulatory-like domain-containing protein, partial [Chloroflexi bacterium]|nr:carboxypeptidase regulatory-like domain-containing protein [Chloroflexota bacterium]